MEKKSILLCALIIFEKVNSRAACVAAATHLHDSHDKVMGEKKTTPCRAPLCGELSLDDDAWKKSSTRLFLFFLCRLAVASYAKGSCFSKRKLLPGKPLSMEDSRN